MKKALLTTLLCLASLSATAADPARDAILSGIKTLNADATLQSVKDSPIPGLKEIRANDQVLYASADGKYLFAGDIIEMATQANLTEKSRSIVRAAKLAESPQADHIVFGKKDNAKKVFVFTDISCGYCQKLHHEIPKLVAAGITVEYLAWPRGGPRSPAIGQMQSVWCASDRAAAYDKAITGIEVPTKKCNSPIRKQFELGEALEVSGTPAVFDSNGNQLGGYVPADQIIKALSNG